MSENNNLHEGEGNTPKKNLEHPSMKDNVSPVSKQVISCKHCASDIRSTAKICPFCRRNQKWYLNFRIGDILLLFSISVSALMVFFSYWNFHEAREERVKAAVALTTATDAATKASDAVMRANDAATKVAQAEATVQGTVERLRKIERASLDVNSTINEMQRKTAIGFNKFEINLKDMKEQTDTLSIYYNARSGERSALNDLIKLAKQSGSRKGTLVRSLLDDTNLYFRDYKYSFQRQQILDKKTRRHYRPAAEQLYEWILKNEDPSMREAAANEISDRKLEYLVQDLVQVTRDDPNLKVACRAAKAIEHLTGEHFEDYPPYYEVERWWAKIGNRYKYSNQLHKLNELPKQTRENDFDKALAILQEISDSRDAMCVSHARMGEIYGVKGDTEKAKQHFKIATEQCEKQTDAMWNYASLLYREGKKDEVIGMLSKMKPWMADEALFEKLCHSSFSSLTNEKKFKKLFDSN